MKAILFDLDGTLVDTESLKAVALSSAVRSFGKTVSPEIYGSVMGESWAIVTEFFFEKAEVQVSPDSFNSVFRDHYSKLIDAKIKENKNTSGFLDLLKERGFTIGVVSSAASWMIEKVLEKAELLDRFDAVVSGDEVKNHKPHPEAYLLILRKLKIDASSAIAFEDSQAGFKAANTAGLKVYGVRHAYNQRHDFNLCQGTIHSFEECLNWDVFKIPG